GVQSTARVLPSSKSTKVSVTGVLPGRFENDVTCGHPASMSSLRSTFVALLAVALGAKAGLCQSAAVRLSLQIPDNVEVSPSAPDSARFAVGDEQPIARRDTVALIDGATVSYDGASGSL